MLQLYRCSQRQSGPRRDIGRSGGSGTAPFSDKLADGGQIIKDPSGTRLGSYVRHNVPDGSIKSCIDVSAAFRETATNQIAVGLDAHRPGVPNFGKENFTVYASTFHGQMDLSQHGANITNNMNKDATVESGFTTIEVPGKFKAMAGAETTIDDHRSTTNNIQRFMSSKGPGL